MDPIQSQFFTDLGSNGSMVGFYYVLATSDNNLSQRIQEVLSGRLTPSEASTEMGSRMNLFISVRDDYLYNNPCIAIFYKYAGILKLLTKGNIATNSSIMNQSDFIFCIKLEDKIINCSYQWIKSRLIFRHYHKNNGDNPVKNQMELNLDGNKSICKPNYYLLSLSSGSNGNNVEYYPIDKEFIIQLNRKSIPNESTERNVDFTMKYNPTLIKLNGLNKESNGLDEAYFKAYDKKCEGDVISNALVGPRQIMKFSRPTNKSFFIKLIIKGYSYPSIYDGYVIITKDGAYSNTISPFYKVENNYIYFNTSNTSVINFTTDVCTYLGVTEESITFESGKQVSNNGKVYLDMDPSAPSIEYNALNYGRNPYSFLYSAGIPDQYRVTSSIHSTKVLWIKNSDINNNRVNLSTLMSDANVDNNTYDISVSLLPSIKDSATNVPIKLEVFNSGIKVTVLADYGRKIQLVNGNNVLLEVKNSIVSYRYYGGTLTVLEVKETYPIFLFDFDSNTKSIYGSKLGIFPDLTKYWIELYDEENLVTQGIPESLSVNSRYTDIGRIRFDITINGNPYEFFSYSKKGYNGIQDSDFYVNKLEFNKTYYRYYPFFPWTTGRRLYFSSYQFFVEDIT